jgi:heavy metal sensor kinase
MNFRSVRFRITAWYGGMFGLSLVFFGFVAYAGMEQYLDRILRNTLRYDGKAIGETILDHAGGQPEGFVQEEIEKRSFNARFIRVTRSDRVVIYESKAPADRSFDPQKIVRRVDLEKEISLDERNAGPRAMMVYAYPFTSTNCVHYLIETGNTYTRTRQTLASLLWMFSWIGPLATLLAITGGWLAIGRALDPVREITRNAERISWQKRDERLPVPMTGDELEQLSRTLNSMLGRLEDAFQRINRFSADVSHELRTPLTIIRGELESIVRQVPCSPQVMDGLGSSLEEVERLSHIVDHLLVLCRLDSGDEPAPNAIVDLGPLATTTAEQMRLLLVEKDLHLVLKVSPNVTVAGAPVRLKQVIVNLLDNAIKFSSTGGTIEIRVAAEGSTACLEVADNGCGIPAEHLPHLFERFYRADKARSRSSGGVGLGLAIVKAIAASHGGTVVVESVEGSGTRFRFSLPAATSRAGVALSEEPAAGLEPAANRLS